MLEEISSILIRESGKEGRYLNPSGKFETFWFCILVQYDWVSGKKLL